MKVKKIEAIHPGEILLEEFLKPMDLSQNRLAMISESLPVESMKSFMGNAG